jgi:hypothetical protein
MAAGKRARDAKTVISIEAMPDVDRTLVLYIRQINLIIRYRRRKVVNIKRLPEICFSLAFPLIFSYRRRTNGGERLGISSGPEVTASSFS